MGRKLSDPNRGTKAYWAILNRLINKKKALNIPPLLENGILVTNVQTKADILNKYFVQQCSIIFNSQSSMFSLKWLNYQSAIGNNLKDLLWIWERS